MYLHYFSSSYDIAQNISHVRSDRFLIHSHPYYELHFVIGGDMEMLYAGQTIRVNPFGLTLIAPDAPHGIRVLSEKPYERYTVHFTEELVPQRVRGILLQIFHTERFPARNNHLPGLGSTNILHVFQEMIRMCALPKEQRDLLAPAMIQGLLTSVYVQMLDIVPMPQRTEKSTVTVQDIRNYIDIHYVEKLSLELLANVFFCSKGYLNTIFRREMDMSIMQYVLYRRLQYAQALIENGYTAINACSLAGFSDYSNFYRSYLKHFGVSPSQDAGTPDGVPFRNLLPVLPLIHPDSPEPPAKAEGRSSIWDLYQQEGAPEEDPSYLVDT